MKAILTKSALKLAALALLVLALSTVYEWTFFEEDLEVEGADMLSRVYEFQESDILYFSASSNYGSNTVESDRRRISQFLNEYYPSLKIGPVDKGALHAGVFAPLVHKIPERSNVKTLVVTMNLRSFGIGWQNSNLETFLQKGIVMYQERPAMINRFLMALKDYEIKSNLERQQDRLRLWAEMPLPYPAPRNTVASWCGMKKWPGDKEKRGLADHFIKNFGWVITEDNPRVKDFDDIVVTAEERGYNLVINLLAENMELADSLVGPMITDLMKQNRDFLIDRYQRASVQVVDNLTAVPDIEFTDRGWPTEHYNQDGRKTVARNLAQALKAFYPDLYQEVSPNTTTDDN